MLPKTIPEKLPGTVIAQRVRCGKPNCRCVRGELHGPYWYRFWRDDRGRLHKQYVRPAGLAEVRAACAARQTEEREIREMLVKGAATVAWFLEGAPYSGDEDDLMRVAAFPRRVRQLTRLASSSGVKPQVSMRAFDILESLRSHYRAEEAGEANERLLFGER